MFAGDAPDWRQDGAHWPNRGASRFVTTAGLRWHVQEFGAADAPVLLLIHGTGAATHSWRDLAPLLATRFRVIAPDLPGHGFTSRPPLHRLSLPGMAEQVGQLLHHLGVAPVVAVGHSAGAPILARMTLDGRIAPRLIVSLNGAFMPYREEQHGLFAALARLLVLNPFVPWAFSRTRSGRASVERLIRQTGSTIDAAGIESYSRLLRRSGHVSAALGMMANFDLVPLIRDVPRLSTRLVLVVGDRDVAVPPDQADKLRAHVPAAEIRSLPGLGHLAHEEAPRQVADLILAEAGPS